MQVSIDGGVTWQELDEVRVQHVVGVEDAGDAILNHTITSEGVIRDVHHETEIVATTSMTAQEITEFMTEDDT